MCTRGVKYRFIVVAGNIFVVSDETVVACRWRIGVISRRKKYRIGTVREYPRDYDNLRDRRTCRPSPFVTGVRLPSRTRPDMFPLRFGAVRTTVSLAGGERQFPKSPTGLAPPPPGYPYKPAGRIGVRSSNTHIPSNDFDIFDDV